jgi:DNA-directed RNA polymerase beta' subunit
MAVHLPLGEEAQAEARNFMSADKNILKPGNGEPVVITKLLDIVLGSYWMTKIVEGEAGEGKIFANPNAAITAADFGEVSFHSKVKILPTDTPKYAQFEGRVFETTVGRLLFNSTLPSDYPFINKEIDRKSITAIIDDLIDRYGVNAVPGILDKIKTFGFKYVTNSGITWSIDDIRVPDAKKKLIEDAKKKSEDVLNEYNEGLLSAEEKARQNIEIWHAAKNDVEKATPEALEKNSSVWDMLKSGARGSTGNLAQMAGMKGLIQNTAGETIEFPILSSYKEGLTPLEYFITTHGARKGLSDTALNTAKAGYLTRRLFDVAQDIVIGEQDCGVKEGVIIAKKSASGIEIPLAKNIKGRHLAADVVDASGAVLFKRGHFILHKDAEAIEKAGVAEVKVRSPVTCKSLVGICAACYGTDLGTGVLVNLGEAVGTVAAQAIGEPGTQLTMRTFHAGGTASVGGDITQGLPRVEEVFERREPKNPAIVATVDGEVVEIRNEGKEKILVVMPEVESRKGKGGYDAQIKEEADKREKFAKSLGASDIQKDEAKRKLESEKEVVANAERDFANYDKRLAEQRALMDKETDPRRKSEFEEGIRNLEKEKGVKAEELKELKKNAGKRIGEAQKEVDRLHGVDEEEALKRIAKERKIEVEQLKKDMKKDADLKASIDAEVSARKVKSDDDKRKESYIDSLVNPKGIFGISSNRVGFIGPVSREAKQAVAQLRKGKKSVKDQLESILKESGEIKKPDEGGESEEAKPAPAPAPAPKP